MLVRFIAVALLGWTVIELSLYWAESHFHGTPIPVVSCILQCIPFVLGVVVLIKSKALAAWISEKLE